MNLDVDLTVDDIPPVQQNFAFSCFYQGSHSLAYTELIDLKVKSMYKDFPPKIRSALLVALKSIVQYKFFSARDNTNEIQTSWFSIVLRNCDSEPQIFQGAAEDFELVPFCLPVVLCAKCCIKGSQARFWKLEAQGGYLFEIPKVPPLKSLNINIVPERYRTPTRAPRPTERRTPTTMQELSGLYPAISPPKHDSPETSVYGLRKVAPRPTTPASFSSSIANNERARSLITSILSDVSLFAGYFHESEKWNVVQKFTQRIAYKGDVLVRQGEPGTDFFVVESGSVGIYFEFNDKLERVSELHEGRFFGDKELQHQSTAAYSAVAEDECVLWRISADEINTDTDIVMDV
jgi:hypothetical protein